MIVQGNTSKVKTNTTQQSKFTINASGHAFRILSDGLYQHKVAAVIRELACNAYDSHVQAGKEDVPFSVTLPNYLDPFFVVEDFGLGLNDDEVRSIYTSYFTSTKQNSNDAVGCFGLGSKTPFTMSDSFSITARKDGVERMYEAFIGPDGAPQVSLALETATLAPNGVKVSIPVNTSRIREFESEASFILSFFKTRPVVKGVTDFEFALESVASDLDKDGIVYRKVKYTGSSLYNKNIYAVMGGVCYPVGFHDLELEDDASQFYDRMIVRHGNTLFLKFNIGDLDVTPSRESLSLNNRTKANLVSKANEDILKLKDMTQKQIDDCENIYKAGLFVQKNFGNLPFFSRTFMYRGKTFEKVVEKRLNCTHFYRVLSRRAISGNTLTLPTLAERRIHVVYTSLGSKATGLMQYGREKARSLTTNDVVLVFKNASESSVRRLFDTIGLLPSIEQYEAPASIKRVRNTPAGKKLEDTKVRAAYYECLVIGKGFKKQLEKVHDLADGEKYAYYEEDSAGMVSYSSLDNVYVGSYSDFISDYIILKKNSRNSRKIDKMKIPSVKELEQKVVNDNKALFLSNFRNSLLPQRGNINYIIQNDPEFSTYPTIGDWQHNYSSIAQRFFVDETDAIREEVKEMTRKMEAKHFYMNSVGSTDVFQRLVDMFVANELKAV